MTTTAAAAAALVGIEGNSSFDEGWSQWEHFDDVVSDGDKAESLTTPAVGVEKEEERPPIDFVILESSLPPQLHPAVSMGMRRMSSCYFSIGSSNNNSSSSTSNESQQGSVADLLSLLEDTSRHQPNSKQQHQPQSASDLLYHDILMNVFTFLDANSLAAFSETARRSNFEVFYFLQLQLQRAILPGNSIKQRNDSASALSSPSPDPLSSIAGVGALSRLSALNLAQAEQGVQDFLDSNSTLRTMPLSHSLAYIRQLFRRHGMFEVSSSRSGSKASPQAMASAALFVAVVGAASFMGSDNASMMAASVNDFSFGTELPNMLFRVGFVGSLMGAAKTMSKGEATMRERAETLARTMHHMSHQLMRQMRGEGIEGGSTRSNTNPDEAQEPSNGSDKKVESFSLQVVEDKNEMLPQQSPNPYEHFNDEKEEKVQKDTKMPSGCVGAYSRVVARASKNVTSILKERRRQNFLALPAAEQRQVSSTFIDACCSDEMLHIVKDIVQVREIIDVEGMYCGSDGTETCALHTSAFHGSYKILEFLCRGIDENDPSNDGGLCDVERKDDNGWTAMHFAAGANSVEAVRILAAHGAELSVEAVNGYTPLQWALRLQNKEVAEELRRRLSERENQTGWISRKPLSMLASRFFALIPTQWEEATENE